MKTEVIMKRELFGEEISQRSKSEFFSATDLVKAGNKWRRVNQLTDFNLSQYLKSKSCTEFCIELDKKYGNPVIKSRGRNSSTWVHPLLFIDIALAINPKLKVEVYEWLFDKLIKFRNDSGDSYKEMAASLYIRYSNHKKYPEFITKVASYIKMKCNVKSWETASQYQLELRDKIHNSIKLLCRVLTDVNQIVRIAIEENIKS